jgi:pentatricopeptide repeat protein
MDYLRILKVPFHPTILIMVGVFTALIVVLEYGGLYGLIASLLIQIWILKYCYVLVEHLADGAPEPPVMDTDMLSPFETRPWVQLALVCLMSSIAWALSGGAGAVVGALVFLWFPASVAILGLGENAFQALNPVKLLRVARGFGVTYLLLLAAQIAGLLLLIVLTKVSLWHPLVIAIALLYEITYFALVGGFVHVRRRELGFEPRRSPERAAARAEAERDKVRNRMVDDVFQLVRIGKHVEATAPLAAWMRDLDGDSASRDAAFVVERLFAWDRPAALNPVGSTLIRHLLRFGRPDAALKLFERLRERAPRFTMDSAADLRTLADYAQTIGRDDLAASMRLETPVFHPPT